MVTIRNERPADAAAREALLDLAYGAARFTKPSQRLREGRLPADGLSLVALDNGRRSSARCGCGTSTPERRARRCCSVRSRFIPIGAAAASARR